ncbi:MAG TPA: FmdB family zinc ribbon protein [Pseudolysinimonas sp.]|jgi:putative FmdB family regulatory protein
MPTYSYRCTECGEAFDIQQAFTDDTLTVCPNCGGPLRKLFNAVGVSFTGSGFYRNDSRPKPASEGGSGSSSSESSTAPAAKSESSSSASPAPAPSPSKE